jgi:hypothetical protein
MDPSEQILALLRELRDAQKESLELQRQSHELYRNRTEKWSEQDKARQAENAAMNAKFEEEHAAHMAWYRTQGRMALFAALLLIVTVAFFAIAAATGWLK